MLENIHIEKELQIVFMGTPEFAVPVLQGLIDNYKVRAVVTQPDKKVGREGLIKYSPIKELALKNSILVLQPTKIRTDYQEIIDLNPDIIITCAYGQIIPKELLELPRLGCINVHASLLPKLRGGAPIQRAIMDGYSKTGITIMYMNEKMDEGDIISQKEIEITQNDSASTLYAKLMVLGKYVLLETLPLIINGTNNRTKQDNMQATYGYNIERVDEKIDFNKTKREIYNKIRGLYNFPISYCIYNDKILKVHSSYVTDNYPTGYNGEIVGITNDGFKVKVSNGEIVITKVQLEGKKVMDAKDFINGEKSKGNFIGNILK